MFSLFSKSIISQWMHSWLSTRQFKYYRKKKNSPFNMYASLPTNVSLCTKGTWSMLFKLNMIIEIYLPGFMCGYTWKFPFLSDSLFLGLHVCLSVCPSVSQSFCLSVSLSVFLSLCLSFCLSLCLCLHIVCQILIKRCSYKRIVLLSTRGILFNSENFC